MSSQTTGIHEGYVWKKGKYNVLRSPWKLRYVVCDGASFSYFESREDRDAGRKCIKGNVVMLEGSHVFMGKATEEGSSAPTKDRFYVTVAGEGQRIWEFRAADDGPTVEAWMSMFREHGSSSARASSRATTVRDLDLIITSGSGARRSLAPAATSPRTPPSPILAAAVVVPTGVADSVSMLATLPVPLMAASEVPVAVAGDLPAGVCMYLSVEYQDGLTSMPKRYKVVLDGTIVRWSSPGKSGSKESASPAETHSLVCEGATVEGLSSGLLLRGVTTQDAPVSVHMLCMKEADKALQRVWLTALKAAGCNCTSLEADAVALTQQARTPKAKHVPVAVVAAPPPTRMGSPTTAPEGSVRTGCCSGMQREAQMCCPCCYSANGRQDGCACALCSLAACGLCACVMGLMR